MWVMTRWVPYEGIEEQDFDSVSALVKALENESDYQKSYITLRPKTEEYEVAEFLKKVNNGEIV